MYQWPTSCRHGPGPATRRCYMANGTTCCRSFTILDSCSWNWTTRNGRFGHTAGRTDPPGYVGCDFVRCRYDKIKQTLSPNTTVPGEVLYTKCPGGTRGSWTDVIVSVVGAISMLGSSRVPPDHILHSTTQGTVAHLGRVCFTLSYRQRTPVVRSLVPPFRGAVRGCIIGVG